MSRRLMSPEEKRRFAEDYQRRLATTPAVDDSASISDPLLISSSAVSDTVGNEEAHSSFTLFDLIHDDAELAWELLRIIVDTVDEDYLPTIGAGDLESFVRLRGVEFADQIERAIRQDLRFLEAFGSVNIGSRMPAAIGRRFNSALRESGMSESKIVDWW